MKTARRVGPLYARIFRTLSGNAGPMLLLALCVFVPLGLVDSLTAQVEIDSVGADSALAVLGTAGAAAAITFTSLVGEVFFSGAVAVSLTHPDHERLPPLAVVARELNYGRLILVDLAYVAAVIVGLVLFVVPGILVFVWFGLSGPVVEIENRGVRAALARSFQLVRGNFLTVLAVLAPVELFGDGLTELAERGAHGLLGDTLLSTWLAEATANVISAPIFAVAAVLLTLELTGRHARGEAAPAPVPAVA